MWKRSRKMSKVDWQQNEILRRVKITLDRFFSNRKLLAGTLVVLVVLLYFGPSWFFRRKAGTSDISSTCLNEHLDDFYSVDVKNFDTFIQRSSSLSSLSYADDKFYAPFVGNGYFGLSLNEKFSPLRIRHGRTTSLLTPLEPLVKIVPKFSYSFFSEASVLEIRNGSATSVTAFNLGEECVLISSTVYTHRSRPSLFVQEISIRNPTMSTLTIALERSVPSVSRFRTVNIEGKLSLNFVRLPVPNAKDLFYAVGVVQHEVPSEVVVKPSSTERFNILTIVSISDALNVTSCAENEKQNEKLLPKLYFDSVKSEAHLYQEHVSVWSKLWLHGFSISYSKAPDVINGDLINATLYYILSNTPSMSNVDAWTFEAKLKQPSISDGCFNFHNTLLYPSKLWSSLKTVDNVLSVSYRWKLTLHNRGCTHLVDAGADGIMQAMMLSLGGLKFTKHHLEFDVEPKELHRDYFFRGILYGDSAFVNIWVEVGSDNRPIMYVSVNSTGEKRKKFYACDAGCLDAPAELGHDRTFFPVKLTDPLTPVLYLTNDQQHLQELQHSIHVKEVAEAPAHEHHVIAMHKHGHRLGGLPTLFWIALIFLLITFHLFLFKLIYNEYCRDEKPAYAPPNRMRYAV